jgi:hypothetical protein
MLRPSTIQLTLESGMPVVAHILDAIHNKCLGGLTRKSAGTTLLSRGRYRIFRRPGVEKYDS